MKVNTKDTDSIFEKGFANYPFNYSVSLRIQSECGKILSRITPNTDTFYAVMYTNKLIFMHKYIYIYIYKPSLKVHQKK